MASAHRVAIVVDPAFGGQLSPLAKRLHVWIVRTPINEVAAEMATESQPDKIEDPLAAGATVFNPHGDTPDEWCRNILDTVEDQHGPYAHNPELSILEVIGTPLTDTLRQEFEDEEYGRFEERPDGFVAYRE